MNQPTYNFDFRLFDSFVDYFFVISSDGEILKANQSASTKFGLNGKGAKPFSDLLETSYKDKTLNSFNKCIETGKSERITSKFTNGNSLYDVELLFIAPENSAKANFVFLTAHDLTEEWKKEDDLLRFYYVSENTVNPLQITDLEGKMIYVNPSFCHVSGFNKEELLGQKPSIFGSGKNSKRYWSKMWQTITDGKVWVGEVENKKKNGEPFYTQLLISPIVDREGKVTGFFGVHRDLSEKRVLEKQLIHTQKMESIGTLAAGIAHEVGNPLASISALVQVAQRSTQDPFINEKLGLVKSQITRISKIIRDLVDFSRPSNYELRLTDINQNIIEAVEITRVGTKAKDIEFKLELDEKIPLLPLIADQIQQVFVNILLNAVDAISEVDEARKHCISSRSDINPSEDTVIITFSDSGKGISEENYAKVFEPFFTTKKEGKGTGLGLWVSYGIVKSFQGDIKVKSQMNKGTTFIITLPIHP
ncbi:MAG: PAS domain-containing protein [Ignavibacteriales bacterium]|nr:MAG: PAS domain-containing protein [Ignavibacteriales bacterium]